MSESVIKGEGWFGLIDERPGSDYIDTLRQHGVKWVEFYAHNPFFGVYAPPDKDTWIIINETNDTVSYEHWVQDFRIDSMRHTSYDSNKTKIDSLHYESIQTYLYFQSFESWKQYFYANVIFSGQIARGANGESLPAWRHCYLMNPDPDGNWGKHILRQIDSLLDKYPNMNGILYDRDDYCDYDYNPLRNDGVTMIDSTPVYMLGFAQEKINDSILNKVHNDIHGTRGKGVWTNGPTSVEVCDSMDGIMSEALTQAPYNQYLGITRPLILLPHDTTAQLTEEKLKTALFTGHFPSISWFDSIDERADSCHSIDKKYKPLFALYKEKKWVLYPHALQLPEGIRGNIFQTPAPDSDYLVPMIDPERYSSKLYPDSARDIFRYDRQAKIKVPAMDEIKYCYLLSGDYKGINQYSIQSYPPQAVIEVNIPAHRVSTLIQLSKEPRYEITRTSSPVLVRGDSGSFEVNVQNISHEKKTYIVQLFTPFNLFSSKPDTFDLEPGSIKKVGILFDVPDTATLGEDTMKVVFKSTGPSGTIMDTVLFTSWVVNLLTFQIPEDLFIHSGKCGDTLAGDTIPFILVNNTKRKLDVTLSGKFAQGRDSVRFGKAPYMLSQRVTLDPFVDTLLIVYIAPESITDIVRIHAKVENKIVNAVRPVEKSMVPDPPNDFFDDDFSSGNMNNWDIASGRWDASDYVAKDTGGGSHLALAPHGMTQQWKNYKVQVNTKLTGSPEPPIDWLRSLIYFRVNTDANGDTNFYCFGFSGWSAGDEINLYKRVSKKWFQLATYSLYPYKIKKDVWYNLRVEIVSGNIKGFWDGKKVIEVEAPDTLLNVGGIGIGALYETMRNFYDDVVVRPIPIPPGR